VQGAMVVECRETKGITEVES